jgi:hypothetical protein
MSPADGARLLTNVARTSSAPNCGVTAARSLGLAVVGAFSAIGVIASVLFALFCPFGLSAFIAAL